MENGVVVVMGCRSLEFSINVVLHKVTSFLLATGTPELSLVEVTFVLLSFRDLTLSVLNPRWELRRCCWQL